MRKLLTCLFFTLALTGCGVMGELVDTKPLPVAPTLSPLEQKIQVTINEARTTLTAAYNLVGYYRQGGIMTRAEGDRYLATLDKYREQAHLAQKALDGKLLTDAQTQADVVKNLITAVHKEIVARQEKLK
jgi:hypothetical protein